MNAVLKVGQREFTLVPHDDSLGGIEVKVFAYLLQAEEPQNKTAISNGLGFPLPQVGVAVDHLVEKGYVTDLGNRAYSASLFPSAAPTEPAEGEEPSPPSHLSLLCNSYLDLDVVPNLRNRMKLYLESNRDPATGRVKNPFGILTAVYIFCYGTNVPPNGPRLMKLAKDAGGAWRLCLLMLRSAAQEIDGDPHNYLVGLLKKHGPDDVDWLDNLPNLAE